MKNYLAFKKKKVLPFVPAGIKLKNTVPSEIKTNNA
jgi:hypothetical protein